MLDDLAPDAPVARWAGERLDSPLWEGRDDGLAYVCEGFACRQPVGTVEALAEQLAPGHAA